MKTTDFETGSPLVTIVLLNWNNWRDTADCVRSLRSLTYTNHRILIVDNGSTDDSVVRLRSTCPETRIIENGENLGFAKGCNVGIREALREGADFIWLLNNDTVADANSLRALVQRALHGERVGAVGSVLYYMHQPEQVQAWGGGRVNFWLGHTRHFRGRVSERKVDYITGASLLIPRGALEDVGLLDEELFMYWDDADYAFRLKRAGWTLAVAENSVIWHKELATFRKRAPQLDAQFNASAVRFFRKHAPLPAVSVWSGVGLRIIKRLVRGDWVRARAVWFGAMAANQDTRLRTLVRSDQSRSAAGRVTQ